MKQEMMRWWGGSGINHASTSSLSFFTGRMLFIMSIEQRHGAEGILYLIGIVENWDVWEKAESVTNSSQ